MKKYNKKHIGEKHITNEGYELTIVDGSSKKNYCTIQIEEWKCEKQYGHIKRGNIKYPFHKTIFGVGYFGVGKYSWGATQKIYNTWHSMMQRCYSSGLHEKHPTYIGATVCKEWHNFQNFAEWHDDNYIGGYELDKDLLSKKYKTYSPSTCLFIPQALNTFLTNKKLNNTNGYNSVYCQRKKWIAKISINNIRVYLGTFDTAIEAHKAYLTARENQATKLRELYKNEYSEEILANIR